MSKNAVSELNVLAEHIGNFIEYWGFKKIHGMIWTHLYLSPTALTAQELIKRLHVSKALISLSLKDLIDYNLVIQTQAPGNRKNKYYTADPHVFEVIRNVLQMREMKMLSQIIQEHKALEGAASLQHKEIDLERYSQLGKMIGGASKTLNCIITMSSINIEFLKEWCSKKSHL